MVTPPSNHMNRDANTVTLADITVRRTRLPEHLEVGDEIGKGTNNRVCKCTWRGKRCVLRVPRRKSDTQQRGSAIWEFRHALRASQLKVGPTVHDAWYARHATPEWPSGLYVVMERFDHDLETILCEDHECMEGAIEKRDIIQSAICKCIESLAKERIFVFDLKPSNLVMRVDETTNEVEVRVIDFGRDFCEWTGCMTDPARNTPHVDMLRRTFEGCVDADERITHVLFACMMVVLSSTTTRTLYETREHHRMDAGTRTNINPIAASTAKLLESMQGRNIAVLRDLLRMDEVRGVLRHYHGRRNSGTHRTLLFAKGCETVPLTCQA